MHVRRRMRAVACPGHGGAAANTPGRAVGASDSRIRKAVRSRVPRDAPVLHRPTARGFAARGWRFRPMQAGRDAAERRARTGLRSRESAGPHRLRAASRIASAPPCSPFACARCASSRAPKARQRTAERGARSHAHGKSAGGPGRRLFACVSRDGARDREHWQPQTNSDRGTARHAGWREAACSTSGLGRDSGFEP